MFWLAQKNAGHGGGFCGKLQSGDLGCQGLNEGLQGMAARVLRAPVCERSQLYLEVVITPAKASRTAVLSECIEQLVLCRPAGLPGLSSRLLCHSELMVVTESPCGPDQGKKLLGLLLTGSTSPHLGIPKWVGQGLAALFG